MAGGKGGPHSGGGRLGLGWGHAVRCEDAVLHNCTPETYVILLANVPAINSIKIIFKVKINKKYDHGFCIVEIVFQPLCQLGN